MKILLWKPGVDDGTMNDLPHSGLCIVATELRDKGHNVNFIDNHFHPVSDETCRGYLEQYEPDVLCLSLVSSEWLLERTQEMLDEAAVKNIEVWLGGPHAYGYGDLLAGDPRITKVIIGELDKNIDLVLNSRDKIVNTGRSDHFTSPDFTLMKQCEDIKIYPVFTSRGCHYNCSFCFATKTHGNKWRKRDLDATFWEELDGLATAFPKIESLAVIDDAFTTDLKHSKSFLKEYLQRGYPYKLSVFNVRADQIDKEVLQLLKQCGVETLAVGIESGDREVFRLVKKGEKLETIEKAIFMIQKAGITPWLNMVVGLPGDGPEAHDRSMAWVATIPRPYIIQWLHFSPYRNTWAYNYFVKRGDIEDGFVPWLQGGRYEELPEMGVFSAEGFDKHEKMLAQLKGYLKSYTPILVLNYEKIEKICRENNLSELYHEWKNNAPIKEYVNSTLQNKMSKGQVSKSCLEKIKNFR